MKALKFILFFLICVSNVAAETFIPSEEDQNVLRVFLVKNPLLDDPIITTDIDNNLTISKNSYRLKDNEIESNACLLTDLYIGNWDYLSTFYNNQDANLYLVENIYNSYGIENVAKILSENSGPKIINFAKTFGIDLSVNTMCENTPSGGDSYLNSEPDVILIPSYLYSLLLEMGSKLMQKISDDDVLISWDFNEIKDLSESYLEFLDEEKNKNIELQAKFERLAEEKNKDYVGSLYLGANVYGYNQNFCTLDYSGDDAVAIIGYRLSGDDMLADQELINYFNLENITLKHSQNQNKFAHVFDDMNEAFLNIKNKINSDVSDYCNFFIDYPENLLKLKNAIERDTGAETSIGKLFDKNITGNKYAISKGFDDYLQFSFADQIGADYKQIKALEAFSILSAPEFKKIQDEIISSQYSNNTSISGVLDYLNDLSQAQTEGVNVVDLKNNRIKEEERVAKITRDAEKKRQKEFAEEYPYTATLSCGMGGSDHINIVACFVGGTYGVDTDLEIRNGQDYQLYKPYNLRQAGSEYYDRFEINLKDSFQIVAQNSSEYLILSLKIIDNATGTKIYEDSASQYGVVSYTKY